MAKEEAQAGNVIFVFFWKKTLKHIGVASRTPLLQSRHPNCTGAASCIPQNP